MIIQSARLLASKGAKATADHVFRGAANERNVVLSGSEQALHDAVDDARHWRRTYAIRHFKIAPRERPTRAQLMEAVTDLALEFGFNEADAVVVGHRKKRFNDAASEFHLHVLAPEVNPINGRVLSSRWSYPRQEKVSRVLEARWGHAVTQGAFNRMIVDRLRADGLDGDADLLIGDGLNVKAKPQSAYTTHQVQAVKRRASRCRPEDDEDTRKLSERTLPEIADQVRECRILSDGPEAFASALDHYGLRCVPGRKDARWIIGVQSRAGDWSYAGALHRLLKVKVGEAETWMGGWMPPEEENDGTKEDAKPSVDGRRLRRAAGRNGRAGPIAGDGQARDDSDHKRCSGRGQRGQPSDELARPGRGDQRGDGAEPDRRLAHGTGSGGAGVEGAVERAAQVGIAAGGTAGRRSSAGRPNNGGTSSTAAKEEEIRRAARLRKLLDAAALEKRFGRQDRTDWLTAAITSLDRHGIEVTPSGSRKISFRCAEDDRTVRERQLRFRALLLKRAYRLTDFLPVEAVLALRRVDVEEDGKYVLLTLWSGTQLLDTGDRVTVKGRADDVAVLELVACVARRGWLAVEVDGDPEFRVAAARELLRQGVEVMDCPLSFEEQAGLRQEAAGTGFDAAALSQAPAHGLRL